jgi:hypothetical protein
MIMYLQPPEALRTVIGTDLAIITAYKSASVIDIECSKNAFILCQVLTSSEAVLA